ncbi:MAG TPA: FecR domain-containing protein [Croceibacterium sp.]|nr:FecR domain-containing protein [Croceibacterium sp.]
MRLFFALILALFAVRAEAATPAPGQDLIYTVKAGDTLIGMAERGMKQWSDHRIVQRINRVADPRKLQIGSTLRVPRRLLRLEPIDARVAAFRGAAQVNGGTARVGMAVAEGTKLSTGTNGFLAIELADGTSLTLPSRARIDVSTLHRIALTGDVVKRFMLVNGRTETQVTPVQRGSTFEIHTPVSVAAVRGTRFRVSVDDENAGSGTGVLEGQVAVTAGEALVEVPAGQGVAVSAQGLGSAVPLLPRPALLDPERLQDSDLVTFAVEPVAGAEFYRAQLATDAGFIDVFAEIESQTPQLSAEGVPNDSLFARFTAISAAGLEGIPANHTFERRLNTITGEVGEAETCPAGRCLRFRWRTGGEGERRFRFQIARSPDGTPVIDRTELTGSELVITDLEPGTYFWRVESAILLDGGRRQSRWMEQQELQVAPVSR